MKKTFHWFESHLVTYTFMDYKKGALDSAPMDVWLSTIGLERLVNKKGTTFKKLTPEQQLALNSLHSAPAILAQNPSVIKRPLVEINGTWFIGFCPEEWERALTQPNR